MPSFSGMVKANDDGACLRLALAQVENEIPARARRAPRRGACEYRRLRAFPIWGIHIQTKSTFICGIIGVGVGGGGGIEFKEARNGFRLPHPSRFCIPALETRPLIGLNHGNSHVKCEKAFYSFYCYCCYVFLDVREHCG